MGLFKKDTPAEKKLKELTGGFRLSSKFIKQLEDNGLTIRDGVKIQNQLKDEIKRGKINENNLEIRLNQLISPHKNPSKKCPECGKTQEADNIFCMYCGYGFNGPRNDSGKITCPVCNKAQDKSNRYCIECGYDFANKKSKPKKKRCPNCNRELFNQTMLCPYCNYDFKTGKVRESKKEKTEIKTKSVSPFDDFSRNVQFLNNYEFNLKTCPDCNTKFLKADPFCFNCGASVVDTDTVKNDNVEFRDGKLVQKQDLQGDELADLEALYNQTVKSKYAPLFKIAYVLYLDSFSKNPSKKSIEKLAKNYDTTHNKLKKQALEDEFIEPAPAISQAKNSKVSDLKEILKEHGLKVSGKKDELIERLAENLSEDELKKYFKSKDYQISSKGEDFLAKNAPILYVYNSKELERVLLTYDLGKIFEEKIYSDDEIYDRLLAYLKRILDEKLNQEVLVDFKSTSNAIAKVQQDKGDLRDALETRLKVFLFDINNYSSYADKPDPGRTKLRKNDVASLVSLMHELTLPIDELKELFEKAYNDVLFKTVITFQDSLIYLLKIFGGEDLDNISREINENYSNPY